MSNHVLDHSYRERSSEYFPFSSSSSSVTWVTVILQLCQQKKSIGIEVRDNGDGWKYLTKPKWGKKL